MAKPGVGPGDVVFVQLATRIPRDLHRQVKLICVRTEDSVMNFVVRALTTELAKTSKKKSK